MSLINARAIFMRDRLNWEKPRVAWFTRRTRHPLAK